MKPSALTLRSSGRHREAGIAIILVLAFIVILTALVFAFFSRALTERQVANSSLNQSKVDILARSAVDVIVGDFKQEIVDGSVSPAPIPTPGVVLYLPKTAANMLPQTSGTPAPVTNPSPSPPTLPVPNLVRRSVQSDPLATPSPAAPAFKAVTTSASAVNSATDPSANGRNISVSRWNLHYLIPKAVTTNDDTAPVTNFIAPDWVMVTTDGPKVLTSPKKDASGNDVTPIGRYAYAIYDEGGLLDANVAGFPSTTPVADSSRKSSLAFADLTKMLITPGGSTPSPASIDNLVGWRNYASAQPDHSPSLWNYTFSPAAANRYTKFVSTNTNGFLSVNPQPSPSPATASSRTDQMFTSRQALIKFRRSANSSVNILQYLTHFSRDLNQPSFAPASSRPKVLGSNNGGNLATGLDDQINPSFLAVRVPTTTSAGRNDGSDLTALEPLVKKRFNLNRLAWITWEGPSFTASTATKNALLNAGVPQTMIDAGTPANIQKYFGLTWNSGFWKYNIHNAGSSPGKGAIMRVGRPSGTGANATLYVQDATREPDFFELLKGSINVGSLGKTAVTSNTAVSAVPTGYDASQVPANFRYGRDVSVDYQIIQIGANIIDQFDPDSYPTRIVFDDGNQPPLEFEGVEDLPYLYYFVNGMLRVEAPTKDPMATFGGTRQYPPPDPAPLVGSPGEGVALQVPALWNPHDVNGSKGSPRPTNFRIVADSADPVTITSGTGSGYTKIYTASVGYDSGPIFSYNAPPTSPQPANGQPIDYTTTGRVLNQSNTALTFSDSFNNVNGTLFREPTLLLRRGGDMNLQSQTYPAGIKNIDLNPVVGASDAVGTSFLGIVLGTFPLRFDALGSDGVTTKTISAGAGFVGPGGIASQPLIYLTYRVQYQDPSGGWITYDTKYGRVSSGRFDFNWNLSASNNNAPTIGASPDAFIPRSWASALDPRSPRFGLFFGAMSFGVATPEPVSPAAYGYIADSQGTNDPTKGISSTLRTDNFGGSYFVDFNTQVPGNGNSYGLGSSDDPVLDVPFPQYGAGWTTSLVHAYQNSRYNFSPGMLSQNNTSAPFYIRVNSTDNPTPSNDEFGKATGNPQPAYYGDADGVVRRAMGAYVPPGSSGSLTGAASPIGLPMAITQRSTASPTLVSDPTKDFNQAQSRPLMLNRPFRSVGELGYVFRDTPWKNLDFFTPESGDAALLDVFCTMDTDDPNGMVAGRVNLNTRQLPVLAAIIGNAYIDDPKVTNATVGTISSNAPTAIGAALVSRTADITSAGNGPLQNLSELVGKWSGTAQAITPSTTYIPDNPPTSTTHKGDLDQMNGYQDGKLSYVGFSGSVTATNPAKDLSSAYATATFNSSSAANNILLRQAMNQIQRFHEAPIRALANSGQTRVWNLMIDVVAQTGRYPTNATALANFVVDGEQRYWVHIAIDRYTGAVLDKQVELVKE